MSDRTLEGRPPPAGALASRTAPAARGVHWVMEGFRLFRLDWPHWLLVAVILTAISFIQLLVPVIGTIALYLLMPVFLGGLMLGVDGRVHGRPFHAGDLFAAFSGDRTGHLVVIGLVWLVLNLVAFSVFLAFVMVFAGAGFLTSLAQSEDMLAAALALTFSLSLLLGLLVYLALLIPITMLVWFAPALVVLEHESAWPAMKHSFVGCLRNFFPYLVYGLVGLVVFPVLLVLTLGLGFLVLVPVGIASIHSACQDIFHRA